MIKKIRTYINILIIIIAIISVIYFIVQLVKRAFVEEKFVVLSEIGEYTIDSNLVTSYNYFNYIETAYANLCESFVNEDYDAIYKIVGDVTKKNYSKDKIMNELKRYNEEILKLYNPVIAENSHVGKVYNFDNNKYIANIVVSPSENNFYIIFIINTSDMTYKIDLVM